ncbi:MAG: DUF4988 domain-containing protein [Muribaculaceae bacterium]|nr:DUF4988 domain-containing protein [Muribaculaceae bacterium]
MNKTIKYICVAATALLCSCSEYDDSGLQSTINDYKERIAQLQKRADAINDELGKLKYLTEGNVILGVEQNSDGQYVITYRDSKGDDHTIVVATSDDVLAVPLLAVDMDPADGLYYWVVVSGNSRDWLLDNGSKVPVCGPTPHLEVSAEGYWVVNGTVLTDKFGNPIMATSTNGGVFKAIEKTVDGDLRITLADGKVITIPVFNTFNLKINADAVTAVADVSAPMTIGYEVTGDAGKTVIVAVAQASGVEAVIDRDARKVTVTFPAGFTEGHIILSAYDLDNVVVRPVIFKKQ